MQGVEKQSGALPTVAWQEQRAMASFRPPKEKDVASAWYMVVEKARQREQLTELMPPALDSEWWVSTSFRASLVLQGDYSAVPDVGSATNRPAI